MDLLCVPLPKACPTECPPEKGNCGYAIDVSGVHVDSCYVGNQACSSICHCLNGWNGLSCTVSDAQRELSAGLVTETMCALAAVARTRDMNEVVEIADIAHWANKLDFLSDEFSSQQLSVESALCILSIVDVVLHNAVEVNVTLHQMQAAWDAIDALLYFRQYFDYVSLTFSSQRKLTLSGNLSMVLKDYCQVAHLLSTQQVPSMSKLANLGFQVETSETFPSHLDNCYMQPVLPSSLVSDEGVSGAPLSAAFCVVSSRSLQFDPNITTLLGAELLEVTPPQSNNNATIFVISVACPPPSPLSPKVMCGRDNIGREDLLCLDDDGIDVTVGFGCTGLITYNATCLDVNVSVFNCSYIFCEFQTGSPSDALICQCSLPEVSHTVLVSFSAIMTSIAVDFIETFATVDKRSGSNTWKTTIALLCVLALLAFALWLTNRADRFQALRVADEAQAAERRGRKKLITATSRKQRMAILSSAIMRDAIASFPVIFNKDSMGEIFLTEMKKSHRWASLLFHYNPRHPRTLRLLVVTSLVNCVLFLNALFFNIAHFNVDQSCEQYLYQQDCIQEPSRFAQSDSKCYWEKRNYKCHYKEPGSHSSATLLTMLALAFFSMPILVLMELIVDCILIRPTSSSMSLAVTPYLDDGDGDGDGDNVNENNGDEEEDEEDEEDFPGASHKTIFYDEEIAVKGARQDIFHLVSALIAHRTALQVSEQRQFDQLWGFASPLGNYVDPVKLDLEMFLKHLVKLDIARRRNDMWADDRTGESNEETRDLAESFKRMADGNQLAVFMKILQDVELSRLHAYQEVRLFRSLSPLERRKRLLMLFVRDLAVGTKGDIVSQMSSEDETVVFRDRMLRPVNAWVKAGSCLFIVIVNMLFLVYVFLFSLGQDIVGQASFLQSFVIWLAVEVLVISTLSMCISHIFLPLWTLYGEVVVRKIQIRTSIEDFSQNTAVRGGSMEKLNMCPYLYVSHRVAAEFPDLAESAVVLGFRSTHPKIPFTSGGNDLHTEQPRQVIVVSFVNKLSSFLLFFMRSLLWQVFVYLVSQQRSSVLSGFPTALMDQ